MTQLVMRVIFEPHGGCRHPLGVFLGDALLRYTRELQLLAATQLADEGTQLVRVAKDGVPNGGVLAVVVDDEIAGVDLHDLVGGALGGQGDPDAAVVAVLLAVAVPRVEQAAGVFRIEGDEAQAVGDEFVGEDGCVRLDLDNVDGDCRDFGLDDAPYRVGKR